MKNHLVSDNICYTVKLESPKQITRNDKITLGEHLALVTLHCGLQSILIKSIRIGGTKYHIQCSSFGTSEDEGRGQTKASLRDLKMEQKSHLRSETIIITINLLL